VDFGLLEGARGGPRRWSGQAGGFKVGSLGRGSISESASLGDWAHKIERSACLRSFPFRKELGRPKMVVPTGFEV